MCWYVLALAGFIKACPSVYHQFLRTVIRTQGFMSFIEDAGVTGELMHVKNKLLAGQTVDFAPAVTPVDAAGLRKSLFGPSSIMSLHTGMI